MCFDKGKPVVRRGRKATGPAQYAQDGGATETLSSVHALLAYRYAIPVIYGDGCNARRR
jgi:hypothetical protein